MAAELQLVAVAAVIVREGRVLAMRRASTKDAGPGLWETLSGRVAAGEEPLAAVRREIIEESGLAVTVETRPIDVYTAERNGVPMVVIVYRASWVGGDVQVSDEHDEFRWLTPADFEELSTLTRLSDAVWKACR
ncbi:MAG: NUDIX domain-containing protein [Myxococcota bacterium]